MAENTEKVELTDDEKKAKVKKVLFIVLGVAVVALVAWYFLRKK